MSSLEELNVNEELEYLRELRDAVERLSNVEAYESYDSDGKLWTAYPSEEIKRLAETFMNVTR